MFRLLRYVVPCCALLGTALPSYAAPPWSAVREPLPAAPQVIGSYAAGCIAGAEPLPWVGAGYQVMRSSRHRYFGHPHLIELVQTLGRQAQMQGYRLLIGDLSQPRGGPTPSGHRSHQSGLDVDVWFLQQPANRILSAAETEQITMPSMVRITEGVMHPRWGARQREVLKQAALAPQVERIFVNAIIKQELCNTESDRSWLRKVRAWWGHDAHFHVRLVCPADSPQCTPQKPLPYDDGCGLEISNWVRDIVNAARAPQTWRKPRPPSAERLPAACQAVLQGSR